jgi:hypothetical protein
MNTLHIDLLLALRNVKPFGLTLELLLTDVRRARHRTATLPEIETAIRELADKRLAAHLESALSGRWKITALGVSALEEEGL